MTRTTYKIAAQPRTLRDQIIEIALDVFGPTYPVKDFTLSAMTSALAWHALRNDWDKFTTPDAVRRFATIQHAVKLFAQPTTDTALAWADANADEPAFEPVATSVSSAVHFGKPVVEAAARSFAYGRGRGWLWASPTVREALIDAEVMDLLRYYVVANPDESITAREITGFRTALVEKLALGVDVGSERLWFRIYDDSKVRLR